MQLDRFKFMITDTIVLHALVFSQVGHHPPPTSWAKKQKQGICGIWRDQVSELLQNDVAWPELGKENHYFLGLLQTCRTMHFIPVALLQPLATLGTASGRQLYAFPTVAGMRSMAQSCLSFFLHLHISQAPLTLENSCSALVWKAQ